jgi:hypothetical protein
VSAKPAMFATSVIYYQFQCYHCYERQTDNYNYQTNSEKEYDNHLHTEHPGKPAYPNKTQLEEFGLTPQGRTWEF